MDTAVRVWCLVWPCARRFYFFARVWYGLYLVAAIAMAFL